MPTCTACGERITSAAERWPGSDGGELCQCCWEADSSRSWWEMVEWMYGGGVVRQSSRWNPHRALLVHIYQTLEDELGGWWCGAPKNEPLGELRDEIRRAVQEMPPGKGG